MFKSQRSRTHLLAYSLLFPSMAIIFLFSYYPSFLSLHDSFFMMDNLRPKGMFVGFDNYSQLFHDEIFRKVLWNNIIFAVGSIPTSMLLAIFFAVQLNKNNTLNKWLRTSIFYPTVIPLIAIANIWLFIYQPDYGLFSRFFDTLGLPNIPWLQSEHWVMPAMILMTIWKQAGFFMIFYLAGLQNIPIDIYEAAYLEGAPSWYIFRRITFPLLMPTTLFVSIIALTDSIKTVDHVFIMTGGGPNNASNLILFYIYKTRFAFGDIGMAATMSVVLIAILLLISTINFFVFDRRIHYH